MVTAADVGGVHIKYLFHCPRQLWLFARGFRPEALSATVQLGEASSNVAERCRQLARGLLKLDSSNGTRVPHGNLRRDADGY